MTSCKHQLTVDQQVDALYEKMSQKERIAQLRSAFLAICQPDSVGSQCTA